MNNLSQSLISKIMRVAIEMLSKSLHKVAPKVFDYGIYENTIDDKPKYDTDFIVNVVQTIIDSKNVKTVEDLFRKIADITVYLKPDVNADIFKKRIQNEYYLPETLVELTQEQKLPEYFDDPNVNDLTKKHMMIIINTHKENYIREIAYELYRIENSDTVRKPVVFNEIIGQMPKILTEKQQMEKMFDIDYDDEKEISINEWKTICVNREDIKDVPDEDIVYYNDNGEIYCLEITNILSQLTETDEPINTYTGNILKMNLFMKLFNYTGIYMNVKKNINKIFLNL